MTLRQIANSKDISLLLGLAFIFIDDDPIVNAITDYIHALDLNELEFRRMNNPCYPLMSFISHKTGIDMNEELPEYITRKLMAYKLGVPIE